MKRVLIHNFSELSQGEGLYSLSSSACKLDKEMMPEVLNCQYVCASTDVLSPNYLRLTQINAWQNRVWCGVFAIRYLDLYLKSVVY